MQKQIKKKLSLARAMANLTRVAVAFLVLALPVIVFTTRARVEGATSSTLNFQARLHDDSGSIVADGNYHVEFKLYDVDTAGTALWTETRTTGNLVTVKNGYLSVYLGSVTAFPSTVDWNEEHWLTMNIGGSDASAVWDGEMNPRIKLTAVPFAFQAQKLAKTDGSGNRGQLRFNTVANNPDIVLPDASGTVCLQNAAACGFLTGTADDFIQNGTTQQTDANFNISASAGVAATIQGAAGSNILAVNQSGGGAALTVGSAGNVTLAADLAVNGGDITSTGALNITPGGALTVGATTQTTLLQGSTATITSTGAGNDITLTSADQVIVNADSTIALNQNTVLAASTTLKITGDTTLNRPACAALGGDNGTLHFDTDTKQLLTCKDGKWMGDRATATLIVAASNSSQSAKDSADYVADGTADQSEINTAMAALPSGGGTVFLLEGTYTIDNDIETPADNITLAGMGQSTVIFMANTFPTDASGNGISVTGEDRITLRDFRLDANVAGNSYNGAAVNVNSGDATDGTHLPGTNITNIHVSNSGGTGINFGTNSSNSSLSGSTSINNATGVDVRGDHLTIAGNVISDNTGDGLNGNANGSFITVTGNTLNSNGAYGVDLFGTTNATLTGNTISSNLDGVRVANAATGTNFSNNVVASNATSGIGLVGGSANSTITGNTVTDNGTLGIVIFQSHRNTVVGNRLHDNGAATANAAIQVDGDATTQANDNRVTDNHLTDTDGTSYAINLTQYAVRTYVAGNTFGNGTDATWNGSGPISDASTSTIYVNQTDNNGNLRNDKSSSAFIFGGSQDTVSVDDVFQIQSGTSDILFTANTFTNRLTVGDGNGTGSATTLLVLDSSTANPGGVAGAMYYNSSTDTFMCYIDDGVTGWTDCSGDASSVTNLQSAYVGGNTILATDAEGDIDLTVSEATNFSVDITGTGSFLVQDGGANTFSIADGGATLLQNTVDSLTAFQILDADGGSPVFNVDTTNERVGIGTATPTHKLTVAGGHIMVGDSATSYTEVGQGNLNVRGYNQAGLIEIEATNGIHDAYVRFDTRSGDDWAVGLDDSDTGKFKVSQNTTLGTNDYFTIQQTGEVGIGTTTPDARLEVGGDLTRSAWGLNGIQLQSSAAIYTDSSTASSGTATNAVFSSFATPTLAATNTSVTTTDAATVYIQGAPTAGTNQTITNAYSLWVDDGLARLDGGLTAAGTVTFSGLDCSANANGGAITADASGVLSCTDDNDTTANAFLQGGNAFAATAVLGTTDANDLRFVTGGATNYRMTISAAGATTVHGSLTAQSGLTVSGAAISLNDSSSFNTTINSGTNTGNVTIGNASGTSNVTISAKAGGSINIGAGTAAKTLNIANGGGSQTVHIGSTDTTSQTSIYAGTNNINLTASGSSDTGVVVRHSSNSTNALLIQSAGGSDTLFRADTSSNRLYVGNQTATTGANTTLLVVDSASTANLPTGVNGGIIYDTTDSKFKIYEGGAWKEVCNMTDLGCGAGATVTLQDAYDNSSPATINVASTNTLTIKSASADNSTSMFRLQDGAGQNLLVADTVNQRIAVGPAAVPANGVLTVGTDTTASSGGIYFGTDTNLYRSAADTLKTDDAFNVAGLFTGEAGATVSGAAISLNASSDFATNINTGSSTGAVTIGNNTGNPQVTIDSGTGSINIGTGAQARTVNLATGGAAQTLTMGSTNGASSTLIQGGTGNITITANGSTDTGTIVNNTNNSINAFRIQSSGSDVLFQADTTNNRIYVGNATASTGADTTLLVVDSAATTNLPTGVNGGIVYDSTDNKFKVYEGGVWKTLCNTVDAGCGAAGTNQDLQEAYDNSSTPATIVTSSSTKDIIFQSGSGFNSTSMFELQSSADTLFTTDTTNNRLYVGNATGTAISDYTLLVLDRAQASSYLTSGVNGGMIYDAEANKFKIYENGAWKTVCNTTDLGCGSAGQSQSLQDAYNNSSSPALITTTSATKDLILRSGIGFNSTSVFQIQDANSDSLFVADTVNQRIAIGNAVAPANSVLTVGSNTTAASGGVYFGTDTNLYRFAANSLRTDGNLQFGEGADRTFNVQGRTTNAAGNGLTISAGNAGSGASAFSGGTLTLQGGSAAGTGDAHGGDVILSGGTGIGNGARGLVVIDTPTFVTTADDANCYTGGALVSSSCTISDSSVSNSSHVIIGFSEEGQTATLPDPVNNATPGRVMYITGANGSLDFTLIVNGGGQSNEIAMRANTSATMVWNGSDWTAAGASSSTTLQAAYDNTLTSAGGAEIVLNNTTSSNGLTVRNNPDNPIVGAVFEVQSAIGNNLFTVNNNAIDYASNGGAETAGATTTTFPSDTWAAAPAGGTVSRNITLANVASGQASVEVVTTATANHGVKNNLTQELDTSTEYQVSFTGKLSSGTFTTLDVYYTRDGGTTTEECVTGQTLVTTHWSKVTCTFTTDATSATDSDIIIRQSDATGRTFYIDNLSVTILTLTSNPSNVQIGSGILGGGPTLLTLDRFSNAPVANGNEFFLGSMYFDTTIGRIQCYESSGWGSCGSPPDTFVNLVPEYPGAVLNGSGVGTMSADFCSNSGTLSVNSSLCSSGQALNYYQWTSPQASEQVYSIYVTYQLPAAFKKFDGNESVSLSARTDSSANGAVTYEMFRSEGGTLAACGSETTVTTSANIWQTVGINGDEETGCGFSTSSANNNVIFKINVKAKSNANVYVGTLSFTILGQ